MGLSWRRVRQHFGISAPRMAVRTHLPWWGRGAVVLSLLAIIAGMWWWGFDFGQILGGFHRKEIETRLASLEADATKYRNEAAELRARSSGGSSHAPTSVTLHRQLRQALPRRGPM